MQGQHQHDCTLITWTKPVHCQDSVLGAQPGVHLIQRGINLRWWNHNENNSCLMCPSAKCRSLRILSALGQIIIIVIIYSCTSEVIIFFQPTYLCMVPTSAGRDERRFPDRFSSVSEGMSHKARGNSDRALFDKLRLFSLQNLEIGREKEGERGRDRKKRADRERERY